MPISSALVTPASCWQIGPTMFAIAGSSPADPGSGAVAVINGQAQSLQLVPGSGQLRIVSSDASVACTVGPGGTYRSLDLGDGRLGPATAGACAAGPPGPTSSGATANLLSQKVQPAAAISTISVSLPPPVSPSYYEYYSYLGDCAPGSGVPCPLFQQGQATYSPSPAGIVVLDFGAPCYVVNAQNVYGTQLFGDYTVCVPDSTIQGLVSAWIKGYESDHGAGTTPITLAIGTSNSLTGVDPGYTLTNAQMQVTGQDWYQQVVAATGTAGLAAPVTAWGASDMEQSSSGNWYPGTPTVDFVQGYSSASPAKSNCSQSQTGYLADYGDDVLGGSGSGDGWTVSQVYQVAWGIPAACAVPEIYYSGMASEWQALSQWGSQNSSSGAIIFTGVMTESGAGFTPTQGWDQLQQATGQNIPTLTNIGQSLQGQPPQVSSVAPAQGPPAGGTTVVISGANHPGGLFRRQSRRQLHCRLREPGDRDLARGVARLRGCRRGDQPGKQRRPGHRRVRLRLCWRLPSIGAGANRGHQARIGLSRQRPASRPRRGHRRPCRGPGRGPLHRGRRRPRQCDHRRPDRRRLCDRVPHGPPGATGLNRELLPRINQGQPGVGHPGAGRGNLHLQRRRHDPGHSRR
ncbi:MAG: hypothetical protein ACYDC5_07965 [Candidatus Dormibacteria bacterium]